MASVRKAAQCIGLSGPISVAHDFFGFWFGTPAGTLVSLSRQLRLLQGKHFHLNVIRVAPFDNASLIRIDRAVQGARDTYAPFDVGIGRVLHFHVPQGGYEVIMSSDVATDLFDSWSAPGDGIDAFFTYSIAGPLSGLSPIDGSCDKDDKDSGLAVGVVDSGNLGRILAHEIGHFLGLDHEDDLPQNLMYSGKLTASALYGGQVGVIKLHCAMRPGCTI